MKSEKLVLVEEEMVRNAEENPELEVKEMKKIVEEYKEDVLESRFSRESYIMRGDAFYEVYETVKEEAQRGDEFGRVYLKILINRRD